MFLNEPHSTHRYYGELLESNRGRIFLDAHSPYPYYTSALACGIADSLCRRGQLPGWCRTFRFHLMMLLRIDKGGELTPPLVGKKAEEYCEKLCAILWDHAKALAAFQDAAKRLDARLEAFKGEKALATRLRHFTSFLIPNLADRQRGIVKFFDINRSFGFIKAGLPRDVYVSSGQIKGTKHRYLRKGEVVEFDVLETNQGPEALDVKLVPRQS
jgi:cold shock CspA family protein